MMKRSCVGSAVTKAVLALCSLWVHNAGANPVYLGDISVWSIPSRQIAVPNGYCISEAILTISNVSVFGDNSSRLCVYLMPDKTNGYYGPPPVANNTPSTSFASYGISLADFEPNDIVNGILRIRLSLLSDTSLKSPYLNTIKNLQSTDGTPLSLSPALIQLTDYLGTSPSVAFGLCANGFTFNSISLTTVCRAYSATQSTRAFTVNSGNLRPPVLDSLPSMSTQEGQPISLTLNAVDTDNDPLLYYGLNLPEGSVLSGNQFTWTPSWSQAGDYCIRFVVSDGKNSHYRDMQMTVWNTNGPPVLCSNAYHAGQVRKLLTFPVTAEDPDGDPVIITPLNLPNGSVFQSNWFSWIPGTTQTGRYEIKFAVSDGSLQKQFTLIIDISSATTSGTYFVF